jgi:hypothetical protein
VTSATDPYVDPGDVSGVPYHSQDMVHKVIDLRVWKNRHS